MGSAYPLSPGYIGHQPVLLSQVRYPASHSSPNSAESDRAPYAAVCASSLTIDAIAPHPLPAGKDMGPIRSRLLRTMLAAVAVAAPPAATRSQTPHQPLHTYI